MGNIRSAMNNSKYKANAEELIKAIGAYSEIELRSCHLEISDINSLVRIEKGGDYYIVTDDISKTSASYKLDEVIAYINFCHTPDKRYMIVSSFKTEIELILGE